MDTGQLLDFLLRCAAINYAILLLWFAVFTLAHDWTYRVHARWFRITPENFDAINYVVIGAYKVGIILFLIVPAIALYWARS